MARQISVACNGAPYVAAAMEINNKIFLCSVLRDLQFGWHPTRVDHGPVHFDGKITSSGFDIRSELFKVDRAIT